MIKCLYAISCILIQATILGSNRTVHKVLVGDYSQG
jgi:hypothetical protein